MKFRKLSKEATTNTNTNSRLTTLHPNAANPFQVSVRPPYLPALQRYCGVINVQSSRSHAASNHKNYPTQLENLTQKSKQLQLRNQHRQPLPPKVLKVTMCVCVCAKELIATRRDDHSAAAVDNFTKWCFKGWGRFACLAVITGLYISHKST